MDGRKHTARTALRLKRYTYGDQWSDPVRLPSGLTVSEGEAAGNGGERPMTNNLIRQLVKSVVGLLPA